MEAAAATANEELLRSAPSSQHPGLIVYWCLALSFRLEQTIAACPSHRLEAFSMKVIIFKGFFLCCTSKRGLGGPAVEGNTACSTGLKRTLNRPCAPAVAEDFDEAVTTSLPLCELNKHPLHQQWDSKLGRPVQVAEVGNLQNHQEREREEPN